MNEETEKRSAQIGVKMSPKMRDEMNRIGIEAGVEGGAALLFLAAKALLDYAEKFGGRAIPLDMAIAQKSQAEKQAAAAHLKRIQDRGTK